MKKVIVILMGLMLSVNAMAMYESGTAMFSLQGGAGFGVTSGESSLDGAKTGETYPYSLGAQFGFFFADSNALVFGAAYTVSPVMIKNKDDDSLKIESKFIDLNLGYRGYSEVIFFGFGLTYGMKTGDWKGTLDISGTETDLGNLKDEYKKDNVALYGEVGLAIPLSETVNFDLGVKFSLGLTPVFDGSGSAMDGEKYRTSSLLVTGGLTFLF